MKVLLVNGSPREKGCTYTALSQVAAALKEEGIDSDFYWIGNRAVGGCIECRKCAQTGRCVFNGPVNEFTELACGYDGFVFGSPVFYSGINGNMKSFLDRVFFSTMNKEPHPFRFKPAAALVSARRAGTTAALDHLYKFIMYHQMPAASSNYWNMVHGNSPEQVLQDKEGMQIMRILGRNLAWLLKLKECGEKAGIMPPAQEEKIRTNFIR